MNDEGSAAVGSHEGVRTAAMCCAVGSNYIPMEGAAAARTCWPAENGLARIACKILCCSFSSIGRSSFRRSEQQSEGKHTTGDCWCFFAARDTEQTLQRHGPENASQRGLLTSGPQCGRSAEPSVYKSR